jgi:ParB-like chromosome segregation protein Spo0J
MMTKHGYKQEELAKVIGKARTTVTELLSLNTLPDEIKNECRTSDIASKSALIEIVRLGNTKDQLKFWEDMKQGGVRTVRAARAMKSGEKGPSLKPVTKPKKLFHTAHKASVIVQSETSQLTPEQITSALREALEQSEKPNEKERRTSDISGFLFPPAFKKTRVREPCSRIRVLLEASPVPSLHRGGEGGARRAAHSNGLRGVVGGALTPDCLGFPHGTLALARTSCCPNEHG